MNDIAVSMMKSVIRQMLDPQKEAYMSGFPDDLSNPLDEQPPRKNPHAKALGKLGGKAKSEAKAASSRENGKLGGRPKKKPE